eukprot:gb/GEZN01023553.1/.p1 GENE.gb/GEZN01023553.1/~~gb/GEZN01023553.1/.p1  ORF type:complete len:133 (-),score=7.92 gb/GEZN01023553.1/:115-513(-)
MQAQPPTKCLQCGKMNEFGVQFCPDCGTRPGSKITPNYAYDPSKNKEQSEKCQGCDFAVSKTSAVVGLGKYWHKACYFCQKCPRHLASDNVATFALQNGKLICGPCRAPRFCGDCGVKSSATKFCESCGGKL